MLGRLSVRKYTPKTAKKGKETTARKKKLQDVALILADVALSR